ncbi:MAG: SCO family protein [Gemmatimonadales bacterium]
MQHSNRLAVLGLLSTAALVAGFLAFRAGKPPELPVYWHAPEFALVDQDGDTLRSSDLAGTVWVASFVFTHCTDICPRVTREMARLRDSLQADRLLGQQVRLVSFSVDPARDTPEVLREYAGRYGGSPAREWAFLTGDPPEMVQRLIEQGFHLAATPLPAGPADTVAGYQVMHSVRVELVDRTGQVRGTYQATEPEAMEKLAADLRRLLE